MLRPAFEHVRRAARRHLPSRMDRPSCSYIGTTHRSSISLPASVKQRSSCREQMKVFTGNNIDDKYHKENIEAAADRQSPSAARRLARLVGFVLGAEGRRSTKTEDVAT